MRYSSLVERVGGPTVAAWDIHYAAMAAKARGEEVFVLSVGDPEFATPAPIIETAVEALRAGDTHYAAVSGRPALRAAVAEAFSADSGVPTTPDEVIITAGAQNALFSAAMCLLEPGDDALVPEPMYLTYKAAVEASGARLVPIPAEPEGLRLTPEAMAKAITPRTRAIFFATPCNPTGVVMSRAELEGVAALVRAHDLWAVSDEVYASLVFDRPHISIASLPGMKERAVTLGSLSKSHAMAGWRVGWAIGPQELIGHMSNLAMCMTYGQAGFTQQAALEALRGRAEYERAARETYRRRRDIMLAEMEGAPGIILRRPEAGMFLLMDVRGTGMSAQDFAWSLLRAEGVATLDAETFGPSAAGLLRVGFVLEDERLREAARRIRRHAARLMEKS